MTLRDKIAHAILPALVVGSLMGAVYQVYEWLTR